MFFIYILKLEQNKFYVGLSDNPEKRFLQHQNQLISSTCLYTEIYKPISIIEVIETSDPFDEDKYVKKYIKLL